MTKTYVVISGKNIKLPVITSNVVSIHGKLTTVIFLKNECIGVDYDGKSIEMSISLIGKNLFIIHQDENIVVINGDVTRINYVDKNGNVFDSEEIEPCDE